MSERRHVPASTGGRAGQPARSPGVPGQGQPEPQPSPHQPIVAYPGYDVLSQQDHWDEATRRLILQRIHEVPPIRYFDDAEVQLLEAVVERLLPQDDRPPPDRIPIVPWVDARCFERVTDGTRYADLPPDEEAWRIGLRGIDETATLLFGRRFVELPPNQRDAVLQRVGSGTAPGSVWEKLPARRFWGAILIRQVTSIYYAHPTAWNEIGFGGPAYPRGYLALNHGRPEPWEVREVRLDAITDQP
jgi:hypothetical protein